MGSPTGHLNAPRLRSQLLDWYDANRRDLPWRHTADPYCIWISEVMLQQTRVAVVIDRYRSFLERFPTVASLASATDQQVLALWSGLGYYRRARMLLHAARFVMDHLGGVMPSEARELRKLPGIGAYTAAAIASIAHGERIAVVDGNVERVLCRIAGLDAATTGKAALRDEVEAIAGELVDTKRPGDFNQAMMELGATVCLPRNPQCLVCPVAPHCATRGEHPTVPRPRMQTRTAAHALCVREAKAGSRVLLVQRPATETVMPGLWELPPLDDARFPHQQVRMTVKHAIMQVNYTVRIIATPAAEIPQSRRTRRWVRVQELHSMALTGLARKVLARAHLLAPREEKRRMPSAP